MIRSATPADLREVEVVVHAAYSPYVARIGKEPGPMQDDYASLIDHGRVYVIDDGGVVGVLVLIPEREAMLLDNVAVRPEAQGKGYGRRLLAFAEDEARRHGLSRVRLYTNVLMVENLSLYPSLGYIETHRGEQNGYSRVFMEKLHSLTQFPISPFVERRRWRLRPSVMRRLNGPQSLSSRPA